MDKSSSTSGLFKLFKETYELKQKYPDILVPAPKFVLVGSQSAGKSTIAELLAGFPINVVKNEVGTRRPLEVTCQFDDSREVPLCTIDGEVVAQTQVAEKVAALNRELEGKAGDEGRFSNQYIKLHIQSKHVMNLIFVDPPGLRKDGSQKAKMIEEILTKNIREADSIVVCVLDTDDFGNQRAISFLVETFTQKWIENTDVLYIMPHFDKVVDENTTAQTANAALASFHSRPWLKPIHIISRCRDVGANPSFKERLQHIQDIPNEEKKRVSTWIEKLNAHSRGSGAQVFDGKYMSSIGWDVVQMQIQTRLMSILRRSLPQNVGVLEELVQKTDADITRFEEMMQDEDVEKLVPKLQTFAIAVAKAVKSYIDGDLKAAGVLGSQEIGRTLAQEIEEAKEKSWPSIEPACSSDADEKAWFEVQHMNTMGNATLCLYGGAQFGRALNLFNAALEESLNLEMNDEMIVNAIGSLAAGHEERATAKLVTTLMSRAVHPAINYFIKKTAYLSFRLLNVALWHLAKTEYRELAERFATNWFYDKLTSNCLEFVKELMRDCSTHAHLAAKASYETISPDLHLLVGSSTFEQEWLPTKRSASVTAAAMNCMKVAVKQQVHILFRLNKINLNNTIRTHFIVKFRDDLPQKFSGMEYPRDEIKALFGLNATNLRTRVQKLRQKRDQLQEVISQYRESQRSLQSLGD